MKLFPYILNWFVDCFFSRLTPAWRRKGRETATALKLYLNTYRPKLAEEELQTCGTMLTDLQIALHRWDKEETVRLTKLAEVHCDPLPGFKRPAVLELAESFFVIMVVFLGIRTYYAQPFRIPTGSMQPTLNGIILHPVEEIPSLPKRAWDMVTLGSSYVNEVADCDKVITNIEDRPKLKILVETIITFSDNSTVSIPSSKGAVIQYLKEQGLLTESLLGGVRPRLIRAGEPIIRARVDAGDMVIVNRVAYHFRRPVRGETFVFDTRAINTSMKTGVNMEDQGSGTHYIKRLCGLPGDTLFVKSPLLLVNGEPAKEPTIARVMAGKAPYNATGYQTLSFKLQPSAFLTDRGSVQLQDNRTDFNLREYAALGDNTTNSLDSRYWGPVRQFNIVGPATFALWPFTSHWGYIE